MEKNYILEKKNLINYPKNIQYLFSLPLSKNKKEQIQIRLNSKDKLNLLSYFFILSELQQIPKTKIQRKISHILTKYNISHITNWSFKQHNEYTNLSTKQLINFSNNYIYDIYGIIIYHGRLIQFIIDTKEIDKSILYQLNINLLQPKISLKKEIKNFIQSIKHNKYLLCDYEIPSNQFIQEYNLNHIISCKYSFKNDYDSDDDKYFIKETIVDDKKFIISDNDIKLILYNKKDLHPNTKYDNFIKLI